MNLVTFARDLLTLLFRMFITAFSRLVNLSAPRFRPSLMDFGRQIDKLLMAIISFGFMT